MLCEVVDGAARKGHKVQNRYVKKRSNGSSWLTSQEAGCDLTGGHSPACYTACILVIVTIQVEL